ncbi:hypothetical protein pEaSNUABM37_00136 [Erwinia phage pEa_SNUABM_37]|nr:hypothetical protein pEaSNUABM37_00136 [Erwinia phage pEa_SNUABM_37]QXO10606.1 hypothetical protein pEaSNUABM48_00136 [Erwinia phage pEa_SNUABM_48]
MSGKKNNATKLARREAEKANPLHWELEWINKITPAIQEFANQSVRLRFKRDVVAEDRANWTWGSDVDIENELRRVVVTEWFVPIVNGKPVVYLEDGSLNPNMVAHKFILRYDHLRAAAQMASQKGTAPNIGRYYLPEVTVVPGAKGWEANFEVNELRAKEIVRKALDRLDDYKLDLVKEFGEESDAGKYIGLTLVYNDEDNLLQLVTHSKEALDVIERKDGEMNYIDLPEIEIDDLAIDGWDANKLNIRSAVARVAAEHRMWDRVVKPSQAAYKRFSGDIADYIMSLVEEVYNRAHAAKPADATLFFEQDVTTGFLKASYVDPKATVASVEPQEGADTLVATPVVHEIELAREDAAAILIVAGRIEPDMWFHVDYDVKSRFNAKYGNGKVTILEAVI